MKKFAFSLEQVLQLKISQRKQSEQELAFLTLQKKQLEENLEKLNLEWEQEKRKLSNSKGQVVAADYRIRASYLEFVDQKIEVEKRAKLNVTNEITDKREKLVALVQEINVLERLKEKRIRDYLVGQNRKEQAAADDMTTQRLGFTQVQEMV